MIRNLLALTGLLALALIAAVTLQAQGYFDDYYDDEPPPREAVSTDGYDLSSPAGVRMLEGRINAAIDRVCPDDRTKSLKRFQSVRECREAAVASVRPQMDRAIAQAEGRDRYADYDPPRWNGYNHGSRDAGYAAPPPRAGYRPEYSNAGYRPAPPPAVAAPPAPPPPPGARLVRRTVTTTVTTTNAPGAASASTDTRIVRKISTPAPAARPKAQAKAGDCCQRRSPAFARRPAVAGSWLPPVAWAAADRATLRAFRTGKLVRWSLTDRDGILRTGYVTVSAARWIGGCPCRNVQVVKYVGARQLIVASGMRCLSGGTLVNRSR